MRSEVAYEKFMNSLQKLISHTVLATDDECELLISTNTRTNTHVCLDLWSTANSKIIHLEFRWVRVLGTYHAQEIAELWLDEHNDYPIDALASILKEKLKGFSNVSRRATPLPSQILPLPKATSDVEIIDWNSFLKIK